MSIAGSVTDLSISQLLGPTEPTDVEIGSFVNQQRMSCCPVARTSSTTPTRSSRTSGARWWRVFRRSEGPQRYLRHAVCLVLAGGIPLNVISGAALLITGGVNNINYGQLLSQISRCSAGSLVGHPRRRVHAEADPGASTGDPDFSDRSSFTTVDHDFQQMPLGFNFVVQSPDLPQFKNTYVDGLHPARRRERSGPRRRSARPRRGGAHGDPD